MEESFFQFFLYCFKNLIFIFNSGNNIFHHFANKKPHYNERIRNGHMHKMVSSRKYLFKICTQATFKILQCLLQVSQPLFS